MNLYSYSGDRPVDATDPTGKLSVICPAVARSARYLVAKKGKSNEECCKEAKKEKLDDGDAGGVVCCEGRKVSCSWARPEPGKGGEILLKCDLEHEDVHHAHVDECPKTGLSRPDFKKGVNLSQAECDAYKVSFKCYEKGLKECDEIKDDREKKKCSDLVKKTWDFYIKAANKTYNCGFRPRE